MILAVGLYVLAGLSALYWIWRAPHHGLWILLVLLPVHTLLMLLVFHYFHPSKTVLSLFQVWKDVVVVACLVRLVTLKHSWRGQRWHPVDTAVTLLAGLSVASIVLHPQLGIASQVLALRNDFMFIPLYAIGRLMATTDWIRNRTLVVIAATSGVAAAAGMLERLIDPLPLIVSLELPKYLDFNFHQRFVSYQGLPYSYFLSNFGRRVGSVFLDPVEFAESSAIALAVAGGLLLATGQARRFGAIILGAGIVSAVLAGGRLELLITPVLLGLICLALSRLWPTLLAVAGLAVLYGVFFVTFYSWPYRAAGADLSHPAVSPGAPQTVVGAAGSPSPAGVASGIDPSTASHLEGIRVALSDVIHHPLGQGLGTAGLSGARSHGSGIAEGQVLVTVHSLGDPGLVLLTLIVVSGFIVSFRALRASIGSERQIAVAACVVVAAIALTLPVAEIMSNTLVMTVGFWSLGQVIRHQSWLAGGSVRDAQRPEGVA